MHLSPPSIDTNQSRPLMPKSEVLSPSGSLVPNQYLGFHPHQGLSCPSSLGFYHPTQSSDLDFVLPQQACESGILLGLVSRDIDVNVESFTFLFLFSCVFLFFSFLFHVLLSFFISFLF